MSIVKFLRMAGNDDLPLPAYATPGAAGMDLRAFLPEGALMIEPGRIVRVPTGFAVELPPLTEMQIRPRSGLAARWGIMIPNSPGTVDADYRGEIQVILLNMGLEAFRVAHGDRIAQAVVSDIRRPDIMEVNSLAETARGSGGFGSTGVDS